MSSLRKFDREHAIADLANIESIISRLDARDFLTRLSLESRLEEVRDYVNRLELVPDEGLASIALYFGGAPVIASQGIESEFAADALGQFQDLVAKYLANTEGELGQRGVVPNKSASKLHITNIVRGSFGFLLEEANPQRSLVSTDLKTAVHGVSDLFRSLSGEHEEDFEQQLEDVDSRVLDAAKSFFDTISKAGATFKTVSDNTELSFSSSTILRAIERANAITMEEELESFSGILLGALPHAHRFEMRLFDQENTIVTGSVDRSLSREDLIRIAREFSGNRVSARLAVKSVFKNSTLKKKVFRLLEISSDG